MELAVGADQSRTAAQVERREEAQQQVVGRAAERDLGTRLAEQGTEAVADPLGLRERTLPLLVDVARRVLERLHLALERDVGPGLVRVAGEQQPLGNAKARVVRGERVGAHSSVRTDHRSGNAGCSSVPAR